MNEMNGAPIPGVAEIGAAPPPPINPDAVQLLEKTLAEVKAGRAWSIGLVVADARGNMNTFNTGDKNLLHLGSVLMQHAILAQILNPPQSRILRPAR